MTSFKTCDTNFVIFTIIRRRYHLRQQSNKRIVDNLCLFAGYTEKIMLCTKIYNSSLYQKI